MLALLLHSWSSFCILVVCVCVPLDKFTKVGDLSLMGGYALAFLPQKKRK